MIPELLERGGPALWLLILCSVLGVGIVLERLLYFHRSGLDVGHFLGGIGPALRRGEVTQALQECVSTPGPTARVLRAAIASHRAPADELRETVREATRLELPLVERYLHVLFAVVMTAPMIGLLGTVLALLQTFSRLESSATGLIDSMQLFEGMIQALLSTAAGLAVAIPLYIAYNYLAASARSRLREMERAGVEIIHLLLELRRRPAAEVAHAAHPVPAAGPTATTAATNATNPTTPATSATPATSEATTTAATATASTTSAG